MKKKILIDLRFLKNLNYGFGNMCLFYGYYLKNNAESYKDLDITVLVPPNFVGKFGDNINYLKTKRIYKIFPFLAPKFDVWHSTTQTPRYFSVNEKCSRIMTIHDLNFMYEKSKKRANRRLKCLQANIDLCDLIDVISNFTKGEVQRVLKVEVPIVLNYMGASDITTLDCRKYDLVNTDRKFFFTIGQVVAKKNFHVLLDMMKLMPEYDLYISGQNHFDYSKMIAQRIEDEEINNVFLTGPITFDEKTWMYKNCHAFMFPSLFEGFGLPVIDGMLFEKPVFSSKQTSLHEIGGKHAYFWDNFEAEDMVKVIRDNIDKFYANPQLAIDEREYALSFSMARHFENNLDLYRSLPPKKGSFIKSISNYFKFIFN